MDALTYKIVVRNDQNGEADYLPKTAKWFSERKLLPRVGETIIPLDFGPVMKPFYRVFSVLWNLPKNEIIIALEIKTQLNEHIFI